MKIELKHLAPYLSYKVLVGDGRTPFELTEHNFTNIYRYINVIYLRPLSDLAKEIEVDGEKFVPRDTDLLGKYEISVIPVFDFFDGTGSNQNIDDLPYCVIQKLYQWHFDIYGLIENGLAVDINTL